jgi:hypothetical protein
MTSLPAAVYFLCAVTSAVCAALLLRAHGRWRSRLLLWSGVCFVGLFLNNAVLFVDLVAVPATDLSFLTAITGLGSLLLLLFGLIWERSTE